MRALRGAYALAAFMLIAACAATPVPAPAPQAAAPSHPEGAVFDPALDAGAAVDRALARAATESRLVLLVLGGNWCHDSRALASYLQQEDLRALIAAEYEVVYVNVGLPQTGDGFNLDIGTRFGVEIAGTPTVIALNPAGERLNSAEDAASWRNSASRDPAQVRAALAQWVAAARAS